METNFAHGSGTVTPTFGIAPIWESYYGRALSFLEGARVLAGEDSPPLIALALLCGQSLECALKAYLTRANKDPETVRARRIRHDLVELWKVAQTDGLALPEPAPSWLGVLGFIHSEPYELRYAGNFNVVAIPAAQPMTEDLDGVLRAVRSRL